MQAVYCVIFTFLLFHFPCLVLTEPEQTRDAFLMKQVRKFLFSLRESNSDSKMPVRYNVTAVCLDQGFNSDLSGLCQPQSPKYENTFMCDADDWNWPLPQNERDFVATFTNGSLFLSETGVCGTESKRVPLSWNCQRDKSTEKNAALNQKVHATITKNVPVCCFGYILNADLMCEPIACENGNCSFLYKCEGNRCRRNDVVVYCTTPCTCPENSTVYCQVPITCYCPLGFILGENRRCEPILTIFCRTTRSSDCTLPMTCSCPAGYIANADDTSCTNMTSRNCQRDDPCSDPKTCRCPEGFVRDSLNSECISIYPLLCANNKCSTPKVCSCPRRYRASRKNDHCEHITRKKHLHITCVCPEGYKEDSLNTKECVTFSKEICQKKRMIKCRDPRHCVCPPEYNLSVDKVQCLPPCPKTGPNINCHSSVKCICPAGFYCTPGSSECLPYCPSGCENGYCSRPYFCTCNSGYTKRNGQCVPECNPGCEHALCTAPNVCTCNPGYILHSYSTHKCVPYCNPPCQNGKCVAPNKCECKENYVLNSMGICELGCPEGCNHGKCVGYRICKCNSGYQPVRERYNECSPVCSNGCPNGYCIAPDTCKCNQGYERKGSKCVPICNQGCKNGNCVLPGVCECYVGYRNEYHHSKDMCVPNCVRPCENGVCHQPNVCTCNDGYIHDPNDHFQCVKPTSICINGFLSGPSTCQCYNGYHLDPHVMNKCVPTCSFPCINGNCTAPEMCVCNPGYHRDDTFSGGVRCLAGCLKGCYNAVCSSGKCICFPGYVKDRSIPDDNVCIPRIQ